MQPVALEHFALRRIQKGENFCSASFPDSLEFRSLRSNKSEGAFSTFTGTATH